MRLKLVFSYDGTPYHGWQVQKNVVTVQGTIGDAFVRLLGRTVDLTGCSRTDTGVHARNFVCHTDVDLPFPPAKLPVVLNAFLPDSIALLSAQEVSEDFHARYSVKTKTYRYRIYPSPIRDPLRDKRVLFWHKPVDLARFEQGASLFVGKRDFSACMASGSKITDPVRTVTHCRGFQQGDELCLEISADGFLYNMVRIIVGTVLSYACGGGVEDIPAVLASGDRTRAGFTAPACGLYLWQVDY